MNAEIPPLPGGRLRSEPPLLDRSAEQIAELKNVRHSELKSISERLDRVIGEPRAQWWENRSLLTLGATAGGAIGLIPFAFSGPPLIALVVYVAVLAGGLFLSKVYWKGADDITAEKAESVTAIKQHIDNYILTSTPRLLAETRRLESPRSEPPAAGSPAPAEASPQARPPPGG